MRSKNPDTASDNAPTAWHSLEPDEVLQRLNSDLRKGLSPKEAQRRLQQTGPNVLQETGVVQWYVILGRQFVDTLIIILFIATLIAGAMGEWIDAVTILVIIIVNGILGFAQEWKAENAIQALKRMLEPKCNVVRDGFEENIDAKYLVPGDVVVLNVGDHVPADLRIIQSSNLTTDESCLTGESESVDKTTDPTDRDTPLAEKSSMAWMSTAVTNGRGLGVVVATGMETEFGRIARITQSVDREITPLHRQLGTLGKQLGLVSVGISALVGISGWLLGKPLLDMVLTGIALAVAVVPEGLPAVVTITLALGVRAMVKRKALLRRMQAAETLGMTTVICTDKTGTLTQNQMTVKRIWLSSGSVEVTGTGYDPAGHIEQKGIKIDPQQNKDLMAVFKTGLHCNHSQLIKMEKGWSQIGEPTETALVVAAYKAWLNPIESSHVVMEIPFSSKRKRMAIIEKDSDGLVAHVKGAPEIILERCTRILKNSEERNLTEEDRQSALAAMHEFAEGGLRTLALARRQLPHLLDEDDIEYDLTLLGIVGIMDPPHSEVPDAVQLSEQAGIRVIMITGDNPHTGMSIAHQIGLKVNQAITGNQLDQMDDDDLREILQEDILFARTTPEHKMRIIKILQNRNEIVAMTGDGVNDAPALKQAQIGISMGMRGTDVAKGASDMILTDDNFASIINAVEEGRREYDNIRNFVHYLMSSNMGEVIAIFLNILIGGPLILLPVQILWMNLITDGVTALALAMEPAETGIMNRPPRPAGEQILNRASIIMICLVGSYIGLVTLALFYHYLGSGLEGSVERAQTVAFVAIILIQMITIFNFRSLYAPITQTRFFSNPWVIAAFVGNLLLQISAVYVPTLQKALHTVPLELRDWGFILLVAVPVFLAIEIYKFLCPLLKPGTVIKEKN